MIKRLAFPFILFFLLVFEGIALDLLPATLTSTEILIIPHWVLVFLILMALFYDTNNTFYSIVYGVFFGLLIDIVYSNILGIYMFVYPFTLYIVLLMKRFLQTNFAVTIFITVISIIITELLLLLIFSIVGIVEITNAHFFVHRLLPSLLANILFLIPIYFLSTTTLNRWSHEQLDKS